MVDQDSEFSFFRDFHVGIDIRIDTSISIRPMTIKFGKLEMYLHYWQGANLPWWAFAHKVAWPFDYVVLRDHLTKTILSLLP